MLKENYHYLNRLSDINSNTGVRFLDYAATPGSHCPMHTALATISRIQGVSSLVVGTAECGYYSRYVMRSPYGMQGELHYVYELESNEVVFGCREGVKSALLQMIEEGAKVIVMIITCIPALIGEDANSIIEEIKELSDAKITFVDAAHFKRNGYVSGYHMVLEQLVGLFEQKTDCERTSVNIFGDAFGNEYERLKAQLIQQGIAINEYGGASSVALLEHASSAMVSIVLSSKMLLAARKLEKDHTIPCISLCTAYSIEDIRKQYNEIESILSISLGEVLDKDLSLVSYQDENTRSFQTVSYISTSAEIDVLSMCAYLSDFGLQPELLHIEEFDATCILAKDQLLQKGYNPYVMYISDKNGVAKALSSIDKLISLGSCPGIEEKQSVSDLKLRSIMMLIGFERSLALLESIKEAVHEVRERENSSDGTI